METKTTKTQGESTVKELLASAISESNAFADKVLRLLEEHNVAVDGTDLLILKAYNGSVVSRIANVQIKLGL